MASTVTKIQCKVLLDNGVDAKGNVKTVSISLPTVSRTGYTDARFIAVSEALEPCLDKTVYALNKVETSTVEE